MNPNSPAEGIAELDRALTTAASVARSHLSGLTGASTAVTAPNLSTTLPDGPTDTVAAIETIAEQVSSGVMPSAGPRYFGFVTGGALPAALAAEVLAAAWDQNVALGVMSPAMAEVEEVAAKWLPDLLGLPEGLSCGFVTGATMANWTALATARQHLLDSVGWDVAARGMAGSPPVTVVVGAERHSAIDLALRYLGIGTDQLVVVPADRQGRMDAAALAPVLAATTRPTIVCAQAGNVNSGAVDPMEPIAAATRAAGAWLHVDAAVGAWLAASPRLRGQLAGWQDADSWALDAHKGLNAGYDSGIVLTRHPQAHRAATQVVAPYLPSSDTVRDGAAWTPESSRRARALGVYAILYQSGRAGVAELVERQCALAAQFASELSAMTGVSVANDVTANQVLVRFAESDDVTDQVVSLIQSGGVCWMGGTTWRGARMMRISVSNWLTGPDDVTRSLVEIRRCLTLATAAAAGRVSGDQ